MLKIQRIQPLVDRVAPFDNLMLSLIEKIPTEMQQFSSNKHILPEKPSIANRDLV